MRPRLVLFGDSITEQSFQSGGWGAALTDLFARQVRARSSLPAPAPVARRELTVPPFGPGGRGAARPQRVQHAVGAQGAAAGHGGRGGRGGPGGRHRLLRRQRRLAARPGAGAPERAARRVPDQPPRHLRLLQGAMALHCYHTHHSATDL